MPNKFDNPINIKTGSFNRLTSNIWARADLKLSGSTKQGHISPAVNNNLIMLVATVKFNKSNHKDLRSDTYEFPHLLMSSSEVYLKCFVYS